MVVLGHLGLETVDNWAPDAGSVWCWHPAPATLAAARQAPISAVPPSYIQARHLRGYRDQAARGREMSRLVVAALDFRGQCDIRTMTYVLNAHLRRHDTFRSWFEFTDTGRIVRHTIGDPGDIELIPAEHGEMTPKQWQDYVLATPGPLEWDCFRFAIIQRDDHFTFCISVDHLHVDATFLGAVFWEIQGMYDALMDGSGPVSLPSVGSYDEYCLRERAYTGALTLESPEIRRWIEFFESTPESLPAFPLPLGDVSLVTRGELLSLQLMDERQTAQFEAACSSAGARFSGGIFATAALAEYELTGSEIYRVVTPTSTRSTPAELMTTGWFVGHIPFAVEVGTSFAETALRAQSCFDASAPLASVPFERVLELAPWLNSTARGGFPMLSFLDAGVPPLSAVIAMNLGRSNAKVFSDGRIAARVCMWVNKFQNETTVTASFPNNPIAHESVARYLEELRSVCVQVAEGRIARPSDIALGRNAVQLQRQRP